MEYYYNSKPWCLFLLSFFILATSVLANFAVFDDYWRQKAADARAAAEASYHPDPMAVTSSFNSAVHKALEKNTTGRALRQQYNGPCMATNPIDRCWRCDPNWADNRKKVARCAKGFGRNARGGVDGEFYVVTDPSDDDMENPKPGTLRYGAIQNKPLWIIFDHDMVISLTQELIMNSNKTIDGRGANIHIAYGASLTIQFIKNVIILNLHIHDTISTPGGLIRDSNNHFGLRTRADGDGISIFGSTNIWIDHVSMWNCSDGLIDIIEGSTSITVSNSHFTQHNDCMLFGASDAFSADKVMQVTMAFNHFGNGLIQRMPRVRFGFVHVVNNEYTHWIMYALGGSMGPTIVSQGNRFTAPDNPRAKEVTKRDFAPEAVWRTWNWTSEDDIMLNGAHFEPAGTAGRAEITKEMTRFDLIKSKPGSFVGRLTRFAGALNCKVGQPC